MKKIKNILLLTVCAVSAYAAEQPGRVQPTYIVTTEIERAPEGWSSVNPNLVQTIDAHPSTSFDSHGTMRPGLDPYQYTPDEYKQYIKVQGNGQVIADPQLSHVHRSGNAPRTLGPKPGQRVGWVLPNDFVDAPQAGGYAYPQGWTPQYQQYQPSGFGHQGQSQQYAAPSSPAPKVHLQPLPLPIVVPKASSQPLPLISLPPVVAPKVHLHPLPLTSQPQSGANQLMHVVDDNKYSNVILAENMSDRSIKGRAARDAYAATQAGAFTSSSADSSQTVLLNKPVKPELYTYSDFIQNEIPQRNKSTVIKYSGVSTQEAAIELMNTGDSVGVLNFANATYIGGSAFNGVNGQEESLIRTTTLFSSLSHLVIPGFDLAAEIKKNSTQIKYDSGATSTLVSGNGVLLSRDISIFRQFNPNTSNYENLTRAYPIVVVTSAAPNLNRGKPKNYQQIIREKIYSQLAAFVHAGVDSIVLGAWGCGAFGNSPADIALAYKELLETTFKGQFKTVVFAIPGQQMRDDFKQVIPLGMPSVAPFSASKAAAPTKSPVTVPPVSIPQPMSASAAPKQPIAAPSGVGLNQQQPVSSQTVPNNQVVPKAAYKKVGDRIVGPNGKLEQVVAVDSQGNPTKTIVID